MTTELEMKLQEILKFELTYLDELEVMVQVLAMQVHGAELLKYVHDIYWLHKDIITAGVKKHLRDPHRLRKIFSQNEDKMKKWYGDAHRGIELVERNSMGFMNRHISRYCLFFRELEKIASKNGNFLDAGLYKDIREVAKGIIVTINQNLTRTKMQVRRRVMMLDSHTCPICWKVWLCYCTTYRKMQTQKFWSTNLQILVFQHAKKCLLKIAV